jgi:F-type H+-transporting ATPase subunit alpha
MTAGPDAHVSRATTPLPLLRARSEADRYRFEPRISEIGRVVAVGDGVIWFAGLPSIGLEDLIETADGKQAFVFHLAADQVGAVLLDRSDTIRSGIEVRNRGRRLVLPVGDDWLGRVVDPLGRALDGAADPGGDEEFAIDGLAPPITDREKVNQPLYTGSKLVDTLLPIGKGQRQLIIGDPGTGKSAIAIDAVIHQKGQGTRCVYVMIGQKRSTVATVLSLLRKQGALDYTAVVVAEATALPGLQYLAPFAGCALAEAFMWRGHDTLIVFDDLTMHAHAYRALSLLLRRPPGREAFPGDIFYLHARLLERATRLAANQGGGSMTALPIIETEQGEISAYIPTNLISITDGQIYFDQRLFARGQLPAIDIARSVSRIGGQAQDAPIRREAGRIKLDYLQFLELENFTKLGAKVDEQTAKRLRRGQVLREALKQPRLAPLSAPHHMAWLIAINEGLLDAKPANAVRAALDRLRARPATDYPPLAADRAQWIEQVRQTLGDA